IDKYCTTLWEGYAICVTESPNPPPEPVIEVKVTTTSDPAVIEDANPGKRHESEAAEPVTVESTCACVDGEEKSATRDVDQLLLVLLRSHASALMEDAAKVSLVKAQNMATVVAIQAGVEALPPIVGTKWLNEDD
ncbi:hypothetical protein KEM54_004428, partial [Ascosphaera aggregata]